MRCCRWQRPCWFHVIIILIIVIMYKSYLVVALDHLMMLLGLLGAASMVMTAVGWIFVAGHFMKQDGIGQEAASLYYTLPCILGALVTIMPQAWVFTRVQRWSRRIRATLQAAQS